jgi:hypothetical protein
MTTEKAVRVSAAILVINCATAATILAIWLVGAFLKTALCELFGIWCSAYAVNPPLFPLPP